MIETRNAIIQRASIGIEDHGLLTAFVTLDYGGACQGFGGYAFYSAGWKGGPGRNAMGLFVYRVLEIAGVSNWHELPGKCVRARADHGNVYAIGHITKDEWFDPSVTFKEMGMA